MVRHHHERLDGRGYPDGLRGDEIPLGARIIAVADTFDAMTSSRAYRRAGTHDRRSETCAARPGTQLDPDAVAAFRATTRRWRPVAGTTLALGGLQRLWAGLGPSPAQIGGFGAALPVAGAIALLGLSTRTPGRALGHQRADSSSIARGVSLAAQPSAPSCFRRPPAASSDRVRHHRRAPPNTRRPAGGRGRAGRRYRGHAGRRAGGVGGQSDPAARAARPARRPRRGRADPADHSRRERHGCRRLRRRRRRARRRRSPTRRSGGSARSRRAPSRRSARRR